MAPPGITSTFGAENGVTLKLTFNVPSKARGKPAQKVSHPQDSQLMWHLQKSNGHFYQLDLRSRLDRTILLNVNPCGSAMYDCQNSLVPKRKKLLRLRPNVWQMVAMFDDPDRIEVSWRDRPFASDPQFVPNTLKLIEDLYLSPNHANFSFIVDGEVIWAHKFVLAGQSEFFAALCDSPMNQSGADFSAHSAQVVKSLLAFIYKGRVEDLDQIAFDLLPLADMCQLQRLKDACEEELCQMVDVDNLPLMYSLATAQKATRLESVCVDLVRNNKPVIITTHSWMQWRTESAQMIIDLLEKT